MDKGVDIFLIDEIAGEGEEAEDMLKLSQSLRRRPFARVSINSSSRKNK